MNVLDRFRLDGRRAVITGGSRGLGFEMARAMAEAGAEVVLASRDLSSAQQSAAQLTEAGLKAHAIEADLSTPEKTTDFCQRVLEAHAPIDILVNNVGGRRINDPTEEMPLETWQQILDLNLTQAFLCTKLLGGEMLKRKYGRVINISSISATMATKQMRGRSYETSKAALSMFTRAVAADWAPYGVTVNAIAPGTFLTDANRRWIEQRPELKPEIESQVPMGRLGDPAEIGPLAVYLASEASSFMTGSVVVIDGGRTIW